MRPRVVVVPEASIRDRVAVEAPHQRNNRPVPINHHQEAGDLDPRPTTTKCRTIISSSKEAREEEVVAETEVDLIIKNPADHPHRQRHRELMVIWMLVDGLIWALSNLSIRLVCLQGTRRRPSCR